MESRKFLTDSAANIFSLVFLGLAGLVLNALVPRFYGPDVLGAVNQVFSVYILTAQLATWGIQYSVLRHLPAHEDNPGKIAVIITSSLRALLPFSLLAGVIMAVLAKPVGFLLGSTLVEAGLFVVAPGVTLFALNKLLLGILNGLQKNKTYAFYNGLRYALVLSSLLIVVFFEAPGKYVPAIFVIPEIILVLLLFPGVAGHAVAKLDREDIAWIASHRKFGFRAMWGGFATALNTRVDVLVLGMFLTDHSVGIYSIVAYIVEMSFQFSVALRRVIDPLFAQQSMEWIEGFIRRGRIYSFGFYALGLGLAAILYPWLIPLYTGDPLYAEGWKPFMAICIGAAAMGAYWPFFGLLSQSGHPREQSFLVLLGLTVNLILNFLLVPFFGLMGAAVATAAAYVLQAIFYRRMTWKLLGIRV